jgi:single-strand DNA-binding protein
MNSVNLTGNICNDLELKKTTNGKSVLQFNLAVKRPFTKDTTDFIPVVVWNQPAEFLSTYARKGSKIGVSGMLTARNWEDKNGNKRTSYEVMANEVELSERKNEGETQGTATYADALGSVAPKKDDLTELAETDDLPF